MNSLYFDSAYLSKLYWAEPGSTEVAACAAEAEELVICIHGRAEFYAVCHRKLREGKVDLLATRAVLNQFHGDLLNGGIRQIPMTDTIVDAVAEIFSTAPAQTFLRAADALHLAAAVESGCEEICSNDRHLLAAASLFGIRGRNVIP